MTSRTVSPHLVLLLAACAVLAWPARARAGGGERRVAAAPPNLAPAASAGPAASAAPAAPREGWLGPAELAIFDDPAFKRRFVESYVAETEIEPRVTVVERDRMEEILELIAAEEIDKAFKLLAKHGGEAASAVFDYTVGSLHFQREELDEAAAAYEIAVEKYPKFRRAWQNLGWARVRQGDFAAALPALTRVIELGGGDGFTYGMLGYAYHSTGNPLSAESAYRMALLLEPDGLDWKKGLAESLFRQERFADAAALFDAMLAEHPESAELWQAQANAYLRLGQPLRAAENLELVDRLGKSTADGLNLLGDIYVNEQLYDLAVASYLRAAADPGASPTRAVRAAKDLVARGALDQTRALVARVEELFGDQLEPATRTDLLRVKARVAVASGAGDEEAAVLEEIVRLDPLDGDAMILLGQHARRAGDLERAVFWYERAAGIDRCEADAKVRHAELLVSQGKYNEAVPLLRRAQVLEPRPYVQDYLEQVERIAQTRK